MIEWTYFLLLPIAFALSAMGTGMVRMYALKRNLLDHPNARSSHEQPTPRGGGLAIVLTFLACLAVAGMAGLASESLAIALGLSGGLVAGVGYWDDHGHVPAGWRLVVQLIAAGVLVYIIGAPPMPDLPGLASFWPSLAGPAGLLFIVWLTNLYNFMDGIDGIASVEAATTAAGGALVMILSNHADATLLPLLLSFTALGFLVWNWPPARIFMGDVGSGFLGVVLAGLALHAGSIAPELFFSWLILLGVFIVDATVTLVRRALRRQRVYEAHRSHSYQHAALHYRSHRPVTVAVGVINLVWLWPLAAAVAMGALPPLPALIASYLPIFLIALYWRAGTADGRRHQPIEADS